MKRTIKFKDKNKNVFEIEVVIEDGRFSMHGNSGRSSGQCQDDIMPKNEWQEKMLDMWKKYHLNDMNAGTIEQEKAIEEWEKKDNKYDYNKVCEYLKSINLYEVMHEGKKYKYGHAWLKRDLPSNIEEEMNIIFDNISEIEQEEKGDITLSDIDKMTDEEIEKLDIDLSEYSEQVLALAYHLELSIEELNDVEEYGQNQYGFGGITYYIGTEKELEDIAREYLEDGELWRMAVESGHETRGLDEWIDEVINMDGYAHILNGWDGTSYTEEVNKTNYEICRQ